MNIILVLSFEIHYTKFNYKAVNKLENLSKVSRTRISNFMGRCRENISQETVHIGGSIQYFFFTTGTETPKC